MRCAKCGYEPELERFKEQVQRGVYMDLTAEEFQELVKSVEARHKKSTQLRIAELELQIASLKCEKIRLEENG